MKIVFDQVSRSFGNVKAVDDLNLTVADGELVALLGPSGCGKSTTLMMLAGLYKPTAGRILFDDQLINDVEPKDRGIGMVFQSYALYPHMTVRENIEFPLEQQRVTTVERRRRAEEAAALVQIEELLHRKPGQLSGGQQQRVALARALVKKPRVLLLDEPLSNLDARLRIDMREQIKRLQHELGLTTILVTHDQEEAMTMADRVALMSRARLQQYATPREMFHRPANLFVANFLGTPPMNFLDVKLEPTKDGLRATGSGVAVVVPGAVALLGAPAKLGIRPHDLTLCEPGEGQIDGEVYLLEDLGRDVLVTLRIDGTSLRCFAPADYSAPLGTRAGLKVDPAKVHLFDSDSGAVISPGRTWK